MTKITEIISTQSLSGVNKRHCRAFDENTWFSARCSDITCYFCAWWSWCVIISWLLICVGVCMCVCKCVFMAGIGCIFSWWQPVQRRWRQVWNRAQDWRPKGRDCWSRMELLPTADTWSQTHAYAFIPTRSKSTQLLILYTSHPVIAHAQIRHAWCYTSLLSQYNRWVSEWHSAINTVHLHHS